MEMTCLHKQEIRIGIRLKGYCLGAFDFLHEGMSYSTEMSVLLFFDLRFESFVMCMQCFSINKCSTVWIIPLPHYKGIQHNTLELSVW